MKEYYNLGLSSLNSSENPKIEQKNSIDDIKNNKNDEDDKNEEKKKEEEKKEENIENKDKVKIAVKFNNKLSESEINIDEALNFLDSDIK